MITEQECRRAQELAKVLGKDSLLFAAARSASAAAKMVEFHRRKQPEQERLAVAATIADAIAGLLEASYTTGLEASVRAKLVETLDWKEQHAIRLLELQKAAIAPGRKT